MRIELGCPIGCSDGPFGELADLVIDPTRRRVTHLVVEPHHTHRLARLVPIDLTSFEGGDREGGISVRCTAEQLRHLPAVEEFAYLRFGEFPLDDPDWEVGVETVLAQPYYDALGVGDNVFDLDPHVGLIYDRIPKGEVEIRRSSTVVSADRKRLGRVDGFVVDADDRITHVILERGHLFGRHEVTVPIGAVTGIATDSVTLALGKDEVGRLPAVPFHRWTSEERSGADSDDAVRLGASP
jgi:sporulation protein YlmC with PRC-barrel domain